MQRTVPSEPTTPANEPLFAAIYFVIVPIYALGVCLNGALLAIIFKYKAVLLTSRIHGIMTLLAFLCLGFSMFIISMHVTALFYGSAAYWSATACGTTTFVLLLLHSNVLLSLERYYYIRLPTDEYLAKRAYFWWTCASCGILILVIVALDATSPTHDRLSPALPLQQTVWIITNTGCGLVSLTLVSCLYARTFSAAAKSLNKDSQSRKTERKVLWNCILMSGAIFVCYLPITLFWIVSNVVELEWYAWFWFKVSADVFVSLDVLITPSLIFYFRCDIRKVVFGERSRAGLIEEDFDTVTVSSDV